MRPFPCGPLLLKGRFGYSMSARCAPTANNRSRSRHRDQGASEASAAKRLLACAGVGRAGNVSAPRASGRWRRERLRPPSGRRAVGRRRAASPPPGVAPALRSASITTPNHPAHDDMGQAPRSRREPCAISSPTALPPKSSRYTTLCTDHQFAYERF